jgi:hypothetical protein
MAIPTLVVEVLVLAIPEALRVVALRLVGVARDVVGALLAVGELLAHERRLGEALVVALGPLRLGLLAAELGVVDESVADRPLGRARLVGVVADVLDVEVVAVAGDVAADG